MRTFGGVAFLTPSVLLADIVVPATVTPPAGGVPT